MNTATAPGKAHRKGISLLELIEIFPDEQSAQDWFESTYWPDGRCCGHCGGTNTKETPDAKPMPYWCPGCRSYFSVRTGTALQNSRLPLRKWAFAVYLYVTSLKGVSSMKLHRDLKVTQKTAWYMLHRLREAWDATGYEEYGGPVEVDETWFGGRRRNMHAKTRRALPGRGSTHMTPVVGARDRKTNKVRARVIKRNDAVTLRRFVMESAHPNAKVYTDEARGYCTIPYYHESITHKSGMYVDGDVHTNGIESVWATIKRAHKGTFHKFSPKHLQRYVDEFVGKHNTRDMDTMEQMRDVLAGLVGRRLLYRDLIAD